MMQIDGGGLGKLVVRVALAGEGWFVGGEVLIFHGHGQQLRRGSTAASGH